MGDVEMKKNTRFFKIAILISALVLCGFILYGIAANRSAKESFRREQADGNYTVPVVVEPVRRMSFTERVVVQGNIEAQNKALVTARIPGTVEAIFVDEGDAVIAGKTKLFQIDSLKLEKAVEMQKQALGVAGCALLEKETRREQVAADLKKAKTDYRRFERLLDEKAVSQDGFEQMALRYKQARVALRHIGTLIDLSREQKHQAQTALAIAEKDLADSLVYAPISGHVVFRLKEPGEMAGPGEPVLKIEDRKTIETVAFLPAQYYGKVLAGKTRVNLRAYDHEIKDLAVDYKSPTIQEKLRTFVIKSIVDNPAGAFVPGAMVEMEVLLSHHTGLAVPSTAIRIRNEGPVIFIVRNNRAHMIPVATGIEDNGQTLISSDKSLENERVVVQGQFLLDDGNAVSCQKELG
jgi:RND family efflux transporter MFP subunit